MPVTGPVCSVKVMKQKPEVTFHTFTFPSSPPVAISCPLGLYATQLTS